MALFMSPGLTTSVAESTGVRNVFADLMGLLSRKLMLGKVQMLWEGLTVMLSARCVDLHSRNGPEIGSLSLVDQVRSQIMTGTVRLKTLPVTRKDISTTFPYSICIWLCLARPCPLRWAKTWPSRLTLPGVGRHDGVKLQAPILFWN
jgi:hypothetical protein